MDLRGGSGSILPGTGQALVHDFHVTAVEDHEAQAIAIGYFDRLLEAEAFDPKDHARFNLVYIKDGS
jgi:hypothetical protein